VPAIGKVTGVSDGETLGRELPVPRRVLSFAPDEIPINPSGTTVEDDALKALTTERLNR
jgi:hypothetical protein